MKEERLHAIEIVNKIKQKLQLNEDKVTNEKIIVDIKNVVMTKNENGDPYPSNSLFCQIKKVLKKGIQNFEVPKNERVCLLKIGTSCYAV